MLYCYDFQKSFPCLCDLRKHEKVHIGLNRACSAMHNRVKIELCMPCFNHNQVHNATIQLFRLMPVDLEQPALILQFFWFFYCV